MNLEPLAAKWRAFGWRVEKINGHDFSEILDYLHRSREHKGRPSIAIASTKKGRGVSFVEEGNRYRHASVLDPEAAERAITELERSRAAGENG
jgi:transketolase